MNILIVDPDTGIFQDYERLLPDRKKFKLAFESSGEKGLPAIEETDEPPDMVIVEQQLTDMDIFDFLEKTVSQNIPVVIASAEASERLIIELLRKGASDYLSKSGFKHGFLEPIIKRASMEYPHYKSSRLLASMVSNTPGYKEVDQEVHDLLLVEKKELERKRAQEKKENPYKRFLVEGRVYDFIHLHVRLRMPPPEAGEHGAASMGSLKNQLLKRFAGIPPLHGGELWSTKEDGLTFAFGPDDAMAALMTALDIYGHTFIQNVTLSNQAENVRVTLTAARGQTIYYRNKSRIVSETMTFCENLAAAESKAGGIFVTEPVLEEFTERGRNYFQFARETATGALFHYHSFI